MFCMKLGSRYGGSVWRCITRFRISLLAGATSYVSVLTMPNTAQAISASRAHARLLNMATLIAS